MGGLCEHCQEYVKQLYMVEFPEPGDCEENSIVYVKHRVCARCGEIEECHPLEESRDERL